MRVYVDPDDVQTLQTDNRGRVYLGSEHADSEVEVAILEHRPDDEGDTEP